MGFYVGSMSENWKTSRAQKAVRDGARKTAAWLRTAKAGGGEQEVVVGVGARNLAPSRCNEVGVGAHKGKKKQFRR